MADAPALAISPAEGLHRLVPTALYAGSFTAGTREQYDALDWLEPPVEQGGIAKPAYEAVLAACAQERPENLRAYAAARRYAVEVGGVGATVGGQTVTVSTARDMRDGMRDTMLAIVVNLRKDGAVLKIFTDGVPRPATNAEAEAAISAAFGHVQKAFDTEGTLGDGIGASPPTITTRAQIDAAFAALIA